MFAVKENLITSITTKIDKSLMMDTVTSLVVGDNARVSGCEGERNAAKYLKNLFESYGLKGQIKEFGLNRPVSVGTGYININDHIYFVKSFNGGTSIPTSLKGDLINIGLGTKEELENIGDLSGKIALVQRGTNTILEKVNIAATAGAEAIIMYNNGDGITTAALGENVPNIPVLSLSRENGEEILQLMSEDTITLTSNNFDVNVVYEKEGKSNNVIATLSCNNNNAKSIVIGAHFDSVSCPGANDNATGVAVVMELARLFTEENIADTLKHNIIFVAFGSEELGLLGSEDFVKNLKDTNTVDSVKAMIALDMVGVGDKIDVFNVKEDISKSLMDSAVKHIEKNNFELGRTGSGMNSSDHAHFELVGIPSCVIETSPAGDYHTEADILDRISSDNLYNVTKLILGILEDIEEMDEVKEI